MSETTVGEREGVGQISPQNRHIILTVPTDDIQSLEVCSVTESEVE